MSLNRIVALITPFAAAGAGAAATGLGEWLGVDVDAGELQALFIAGMVAVLVPAGQWLHGWQKYEAREAELQRDLRLANATVATAAAAPEPLEYEDDWDEGQDEDLSALDELEDLAGLDEFEDEPLDDEVAAEAEV